MKNEVLPGATVFYLANYSYTRNFGKTRKVSKRAEKQKEVMTNYMKSVKNHKKK